MNKKQYKADLHTHSIISYDGGLNAAGYEKALSAELLDCIAITDHNEISFARILQKKWGDQIIVGEEITTKEGEIIGLYLSETIEPGLSALETVKRIRLQNGLVVIPHPFEKMRKGIAPHVLEEIVEYVDILEVFNGRGRGRGKANQAADFAQKHHLIMTANSDAHGYGGLGYTYSNVPSMPNRSNLIELLATNNLHKVYAPFYTYFYPIFNKIKNKIILTNTHLS